jgi:hypothetical protein
MMNREKQWAVGDWVIGKSKNGELIHGFIESIEAQHGNVKVYVVECDNDSTVGKTIVTPSQYVEVLPEAIIDSEEQVLDLIDLALLTQDKAWFMELTTKAASLKKAAPGREAGRPVPTSVRNRLGTSAIWEQ